MPQNYSGRVTVILVVLFGSLACIFSPVLERLFHPHEHIATWLNLKPGIDMVGGTSLVYQIKTAPGAQYKANLAEEVARALKKRVDPNGVKNLVWRPEGADRLEIQMPSSAKGNAEEARAKQEQLLQAERHLEDTNVELSTVEDAIRQKNGHSRAEFAKLADGSKTRLDLMSQMASTYDQIMAILKEPKEQRDHDAVQNAKLNTKFNDLKQKLEATNFNPEDLQRLRDDLSEPSARPVALADLKKRYADFPARLTAVDNFVSAFDQWEKTHGALDDTTDLKRMLRGSGVLEYHILVQPGEAPEQEIAAMEDRLKPDGPGPVLQGGDTMRWFQADNPEEVLGRGFIVADYRHRTYVLAWITPEKSLDHREGQKPWALTGAQPQQDQSSGQYVVAFSMDPQGAKDFGRLTSENLHKPLAVVLDGKLVNAADINSTITANGMIDGGSKGFSKPQLDYLVNTLSAGSLPAQLEEEPISERHVEPELGRSNLVHGMVACFVGVAVVGVFLIGYYYLSGVVAFFAVIMNLLIVLGVMAALQATFTLPSIAGIVLSVGTAVDANVLIFERLREEQHRGLSLRMALRNAYDKAFSAIVDSNATTLITSIFLIWFGTEEVKGFGITLIIGVLASLFTALFVTRTIFGLLVDHAGVRELSSLPLTFPKWDKLLKPSIDWMSFAWVFYAFSGLMLTIGLILFGIKVRQGQMFDIEFAGGTSVTFDLQHRMSKEELSSRLAHSGFEVLSGANPGPLGDAQDGKYASFQVLTPSTNAAAVRNAVMSTLGKDLKLELPSSFTGSGTSGSTPKLDAVLGKQVFAVNDQAHWPTGANGKQFRPDNWGEYRGGGAIVLQDLQPPLTPAEIANRINRQQLEAASGQTGMERYPFVVESPLGPGAPTSLAIVLSKNPNLLYDKDPKQWDEQFAGPLWKMVVEGVDRPAQLKEVRNFDAQVAGDAQTNALLALSLSILVIMAYIWIRFGNLKYGTATMVALLHDTLFTIAALGFAHYLVNVGLLREIFQLEPFRVNLTVVAGILTIMGYSMIDTIVVFDRIRENRGKYGHVSRQVINDAVNQTLSRTLLTCGTTTLTVAVMYFLGGEGIHGFTFVLLIGILVGTYSSVAIAAPILLLGNRGEAIATAGAQPDRQARLQRTGV